MVDCPWKPPSQCGKKSGTEGVDAPTAPEPKPTVTWSRSLPDNITPQRAVEQGHVQNASGPEREHSFKSIGDLAAELVRKAGAQ